MLLLMKKSTRFQIQKERIICFIDNGVINKHNTIYDNDNINVNKTNKLVNLNDNNYFTSEI